MEEFLQRILLSYGRLHLSVGGLLGIVLSVGLALLLIWLLRKYFRVDELRKIGLELAEKPLTRIRRGVQFLLLIGSILMSLQIIGVPVKNFFEFDLIPSARFDLPVYAIFVAIAILLGTRLLSIGLSFASDKATGLNIWKEIDEKRRALITRVAILLIYFLGIVYALNSLGLPVTVSKILEYKLFEIDAYTIQLYNLLAIIVIILLTSLSLWGVRKMLRNMSGAYLELDAGSRHALFQIIKYAIYSLAILLSFRSIGLDISFILASSAALFVGLGFGIQHLFNDFVSGLIILFDSTLQVGDVVEVDGLVGRVKKISLRTSEIVTRNSVTILIPNSKFTSDNVINWSHDNAETRLKVEIGVAYGTDARLVRDTLIECASEHPDVAGKPAPLVMFHEFGDSALIFELYFWSMKAFEAEVVKSDIRFAIDKAFREKKIAIPFPQRDLHIVSDYRHSSKSDS